MGNLQNQNGKKTLTNLKVQNSNDRLRKIWQQPNGIKNQLRKLETIR